RAGSTACSTSAFCPAHGALTSPAGPIVYVVPARRAGVAANTRTNPRAAPTARSMRASLTRYLQYGRAGDLARAQANERLVRLCQREPLDVRLDGHPRRELEELLGVLAGQVRDRAQDSLLPEQLVGQRRDVGHVDPRTDDVAGQPQRAVADQPGAEQWRRVHRRIALRNAEAETRVRNRGLRVAAVDVEPGEARVVAEVLAPALAEAALAVRPAEPGHADPRARLDVRP